jgi:hypothetical protein
MAWPRLSICIHAGGSADFLPVIQNAWPGGKTIPVPSLLAHDHDDDEQSSQREPKPPPVIREPILSLCFGNKRIMTLATCSREKKGPLTTSSGTIHGSGPFFLVYLLFGPFVFGPYFVDDELWMAHILDKCWLLRNLA